MCSVIPSAVEQSPAYQAREIRSAFAQSYDGASDFAVRLSCFDAVSRTILQSDRRCLYRAAQSFVRRWVAIPSRAHGVPCLTRLQLRQYFTHDSARALDVSGRVRRGDEAGFKLRRRKIDAAFQTSVKKTGEYFQIASLRVGEIDDRRGSKEQTKHRTEPVKGDVDVCTLDCVTR